ncbi:MAG: isoprenylcysteine carboxylmethyltransferase family protein [Azospirillaceae bacterium]
MEGVVWPPGWAQAVVAVVALQRLVELAISRRNTARLRAAGAVEHGRGHYPAIVALHALWLAAVALAVPPDRPPDPIFAAVFVAFQAARVWVLASLGARWTTRVLVLPGEARVRTGPYRFLAHPNYAIVMAEIVVLPAAFGAYGLAFAFGLANAGLLAWRIRVEDRALAAAEAMPPGSTAGAPARHPGPVR